MILMGSYICCYAFFAYAYMETVIMYPLKILSWIMYIGYFLAIIMIQSRTKKILYVCICILAMVALPMVIKPIILPREALEKGKIFIQEKHQYEEEVKKAIDVRTMPVEDEHGKMRNFYSMSYNYDHVYYYLVIDPMTGDMNEYIDSLYNNINDMVTVNIASNSDLKYVDPLIHSDENYAISQLLYGQLFRLTKENQLKKDMVESYLVSEDQLTWTFRIKDDMYWSDGRGIKAEDFVFAWRRILKLDAQGYGGMLLRESRISNAESMSEREIVIHLDEPNAKLPLILSDPLFALVPIDVTTGFGDRLFSLTRYKEMVTSGPYIVSYINELGHITLRKNKAYDGESKIRYASIKFKDINSYSEAYEAYTKGEIDLLEMEYLPDLKHKIADNILYGDDRMVEVPENRILFLSLVDTDVSLNEHIWSGIYSCFNKHKEQLITGDLGYVKARRHFIPRGLFYNNSGKDITVDINEVMSTSKDNNVTLMIDSWKIGLEEIGNKDVNLKIMLRDSPFTNNLFENIKSTLEKNLEGIRVYAEYDFDDEDFEYDFESYYLELKFFTFSTKDFNQNIEELFYMSSLNYNTYKALASGISYNDSEFLLIEKELMKKRKLIPLLQYYKQFYVSGEGARYLSNGISYDRYK